MLNVEYSCDVANSGTMNASVKGGVRSGRESGIELLRIVAATTFGVLLIHAANAGMRTWLWKDFLEVPSIYSDPLWLLIAKSVALPICIFAVCSVLDFMRIRLLERPLLGRIAGQVSFDRLHGK